MRSSFSSNALYRACNSEERAPPCGIELASASTSITVFCSEPPIDQLGTLADILLARSIKKLVKASRCCKFNSVILLCRRDEEEEEVVLNAPEEELIPDPEELLPCRELADEEEVRETKRVALRMWAGVSFGAVFASNLFRGST
jgi:hypothetical protein